MITLPQSSVELVCAPDPSSNPEIISDIDTEALQDSLSHKEMKNIWDNTDTTYTEDEKLCLYWHMKLRHKPQKIYQKVSQERYHSKAIKKGG